MPKFFRKEVVVNEYEKDPMPHDEWDPCATINRGIRPECPECGCTLEDNYHCPQCGKLQKG